MHFLAQTASKLLNTGKNRVIFNFNQHYVARWRSALRSNTTKKILIHFNVMSSAIKNIQNEILDINLVFPDSLDSCHSTNKPLDRA